MASLHVASVLKTILVLGLEWLLVVIHTVTHAGKVCLVFYSPLLLLTQIIFGHWVEYMAFLLFWMIEYAIWYKFFFDNYSFVDLLLWVCFVQLFRCYNYCLVRFLFLQVYLLLYSFKSHFVFFGMLGYISTSINDGPGCLMLRCPEPTCGAAIGQDMIDLLACDEDKQKYTRYLLRSYIEDNKKVCNYALNMNYALYVLHVSFPSCIHILLYSESIIH